MSTQDPQQKLVAYADGRLPPDEAAAVERELAADPAARAVVDRLWAFRGAIRRAVVTEPVPDELAARVAARLRAPADEHTSEASAEVRWAPLRGAVDRAMRSETTPPGLVDRVQVALSAAASTSGHVPLRRTRPRSALILRFGLSGLAAAATVVLAVFLWPREAAAVDARGFARIHEKCAVTSRHDSFGLRAAGASEASARIRARAQFAVHMPDLTGCEGQFELDGVCGCSPLQDMVCIHAFYRDRNDPTRVVSVFAAERPFRMCRDGKLCERRGGKSCGYRVTCVDDVTIVAWERDGQYFLLTGRFAEDTLAALQQNMQFAGLPQGRIDFGALAALLKLGPTPR